ncbi:DUF4435 domain-containing protein [Pannus brasiliensis CCIBt3594]|uniref:DUF4435 domain-containing protein n=1 Tax=Pannus brasiliensis CCIBt3594 TaxID=1427578 RepID=A0AAW9QQB6_9CHRO
MNGLQLTPEEYVTEIIMSEDRFLLLEGSDDQDFFTLICNYLKKNGAQISAEKLDSLKSIVIDTAERIQGEIGNRDKIEKICELVSQESSNVNRRVVGFVDREFRGFEYDNYLKDHIKTHKINNRLIWSRGHSIENYFFEISTLKEAFNDYLVSSFYQEAFEIFESKFNHTLRIACALSLAGLSANLLKLIDRSLDWQCIDITSTSIEINLEKWSDILMSRKFNLDQLRIRNLFNQFETYLNRTDQCDIETLRWLSHGHIGFNFMFVVYTKCLFIATSSDQRKNPSDEAKKVNKNKDTRFPTVANAWIRSKSVEFQGNDTHDFPLRCFWILVNERY